MTKPATETPKFRANGHDWPLVISIGKARKLKDELGVDVDKTENGEVFGQLANSRFTLAAALWIICEEQADKLEISPEEFGEMLTGDALEQAADGVIAAIVNFTPSHQRKRVAALVGAQLEAFDRMGDAVQEWTEKATTKKGVDDLIAEQLAEATTQLSGNRSTDSPASSD